MLINIVFYKLRKLQIKDVNLEIPEAQRTKDKQENAKSLNKVINLKVFIFCVFVDS